MAENTRVLSVAEAICEATALCLERDPGVYVLGEGVADPKAVFGTTAGLAQRYGPARVIEMPVSESGLTGVAIGSAMMGQRPVVVHIRVEFALLAMEQIVNNAAKLHYVSLGRNKVPLVLRLIVGRGWGQGPQHSQSLEAMFAQVPGLKVVMPTTAGEAKGLLIAAIEDDNPVVFIEHRWLHDVRGEVPEGYYAVPLSGPRLVRDGEDITVVATSYGILEAMRAADALAGAGCKAEIFDLRMLRPLDLDPVRQSVSRTGRLLIVDSGARTFGVGAEVAASITESCFDALKGPPRRLGLPDHPTPSSRALAEVFYPRPETILDAIADMTAIGKDAAAEARASLADAMKNRLVDVPDEDFTGPF